MKLKIIIILNTFIIVEKIFSNDRGKLEKNRRKNQSELNSSISIFLMLFLKTNASLLIDIIPIPLI